MSNLYGITLDPAWTEWAAKEKVSETVAAAVLLICQNRPVHKVVAKLTPAEFDGVIDIVRRSLDHFPSGTLAALESRCPRPARRPAAHSASPDVRPGQRAARINRTERMRRLHARRRVGRPYAEVPQSATEHATATNFEKAGTHPGTRAETARRRMMVEDLMKAGLSVRTISTGTGIPRSSVHRAMRAVARARAKYEVAVAEIANKLLGKRLSR